MIDWTRPYSVTYRCETLDPQSGMHIGDIDMLSCSLSLSDEGVGMSASMETATPILDYPIVRVSARAEQDGDVETAILFTGKAHCTGRNYQLDDPTYEVECSGLLEFADAMEPDIGFSVPEGTSRANAAAGLLREVLPGWVTVTVTGESPKLADPRIPEDGETNLSMAEDLLDCGWRMRRLGNGDIEICERGGVRARIDVKDNDVLMPDLTDQRDAYEAVSVMRVVTSDGKSIVVKDEALISEVGFERWKTERDVTLSEDETLDSYARRRLAEDDEVNRDVAWTREWIPGLCCGDDISADILSHEIEGTFRISTMDVELGIGITVDEAVTQVG